ncbi:MAG: replication-associated recombination protein A, partial [Abditibacteriales bacterium]|nr:replication-associated recombination protein A [Abditibacteriales bacterium]
MEPLASRMRPRTLEEFVGQEHIVGAGTVLRRAIERDRLTSVIFFGPAGCGKSTLASVIAHTTKAHFENFSAVTSGVADVRRVVTEARARWQRKQQKTLLFVDEIHRFNKAQQDAFLPHVEAGTIVLIGATTENPFFSINAPLLSRARIFRFEPLREEHIRLILQRALQDKERGLGNLAVVVDEAAMDFLVQMSNGDARVALNALEMAVTNSPRLTMAGRGEVHRITLALAEDALQQRALAYDKQGDCHYDILSAYIKSLRGSDPDAALYWLARMLTAGEDPRFIARRLVIHAAEDVGNADPMALVVANAAAQAMEYVGMPEARIPLAQATIYIATAPKSNATVVAVDRAMEDVRTRPPVSVPLHLRDASYPGAQRLGHGKGYLYPHDFPDHFVKQEYLPDGAKSQPYYQPTAQGFEKTIQERM